jgi:primosomal protein N' (replication factor Y) (superfamily II helicase)
VPFIDVILPLPIKQTFTYQVREAEAAYLCPGMRVVVPFGKNKLHTGVVYGVLTHDPPNYQTKEIDQILDTSPSVTLEQIAFWEWMAGYYMCSLGEVMRAALPSALLLESETHIAINTALDIAEIDLSDDEYLVLQALQAQPMLSINDVRSILDRTSVMGILQGLIKRDLVLLQETLYEAYKPLVRRYVRMVPSYLEEAQMQLMLIQLERAPKQRDTILQLIMATQASEEIETLALQKKSNATSSVINALADKGYVSIYEKEKQRNIYQGDAVHEFGGLSAPQQEAFDEICAAHSKLDVCLLHGVTSSGKTEVYIQLMDQYLQQGQQVLFMVPEIALTTQLIGRLQYYFGAKVGVYHSKYSNAERIELYHKVAQGAASAQIIIGARSALFLPFKNLGLVIVDEAHEPSFKQYNPSPRYHGRDAAIMLAHQHKAKVILGSATPSLESYQNALQGKYGLVTLSERYGKVMMPEIVLIDLKEKYKKKRMNGHFSDQLIEAINEVLREGQQVLLFQNRRGFAPVVECLTCGVAPQCPDCDVSLTYHKHKEQLCCHYCGFHQVMPSDCHACGSTTLDHKGFGTEQIETELMELFPDKVIARMDQDTTRGKHAYAKLMDRMDDREIDILVGTQMLAKGLDFEHVQLVGVLNADHLLNFPDFRAHERAYQLLSQVSGRAGRRQKRGLVLIQSYDPNHRILQQVSTCDFEGMFFEQKEQRHQFKYPPFYKLIKVTLKHRDFAVVDKAGFWLTQVLNRGLAPHVLGPVSPSVGRIRNQYLKTLLIKIPQDQSPSKIKAYMHKALQRFAAQKEFARVQVVMDVDAL